MEQYTFRVPADGQGPSFLFDINADGRKDAVLKARRLLCEHENPLHVDLTFGLTCGRLIVPESAISEEGIIAIREHPEFF